MRWRWNVDGRTYAVVLSGSLGGGGIANMLHALHHPEDGNPPVAWLVVSVVGLLTAILLFERWRK